MLNASTDTLLYSKIDSLRMAVESVSVDLRLQSAKTDTMQSVVLNLMQEESSHQAKTDSIIGQLGDIATYGVGVGETASHIVFPLIIALFAFSFAFFFTVITHINGMYNSEHISRMFSKERYYSHFLKGAVACVVYLLFAGVLELSIHGDQYKFFMLFLNWFGLFLSCGYAFVIILFVKRCILYNNPHNMKVLIEQQYELECERATKFIKKQERQKRKNARIKPEGKRRFREVKSQLNKNYAYYGAETNRINRYVDLCKYAIQQKNENLFLTALYAVNKAKGDEHRLDFYTMTFYDKVVELMIQYPQGKELEKSLLRNWFLSFRKDQMPNMGLVYSMLGKMVWAAKNGRVGFFESYLDSSQYGFSFISKLPVVYYVRGGSKEEQIKAGKESLKAWRELREIHFLAAAYLFQLGKYDFVKGVLNAGKFSKRGIYPNTTAEVLMMYSRCKENQDEKTGLFNHNYPLDKVIDDNYDRNMLEQFTSFLLLLVNREELSEYLVSESCYELIIAAKPTFEKLGARWRRHDELSGKYPQILDKDIKVQLKDGLSKLSTGHLVNNKKQNGGTKPSVYDFKVDDKTEENNRWFFRNIIYGNLSAVTDGLNGMNTEGKEDEIDLGVYITLVSKQSLMDVEQMSDHGNFNGLLQMFRNRYLYIVYEALSQMKVAEKECKRENVADLLKTLLGENGEKYIIIDTDTHMSTYIPLDELDDGRKWSVFRTYQNAYIYTVEIDSSFYLKDLSTVENFRDSMMLLKMNDLPFPVSVSEDEMPKIYFDEASNKEKGIAAYMMTVNPMIKVKYSKGAIATRIRII